MLFREIKGYQELKNSLIGLARRQHVPHALMFSSRPGSPNLAMALAFSTFLNCENQQEEDACGICASCVKARKYIHPDIHYVFPVTATKSVKSEDAVSKTFLKEWREFLIQDPFSSIEEWVTFVGGGERKPLIPVRQSRDIINDLSMKSFEGKFKIMIIWLPEMMNRSSANALLKIIEEPPSQTHFILVTNDESSIISTILSRTQKVAIRNWSQEELVQLFENENGYPQSAITSAASLSEGNYHAMKLLLNDLEEDAHEWFRNWMRECYSNDYVALNRLTDEFGKFNRNMRMAIFRYGLHIMREILVFEISDQVQKLTNEEKEFVSKFSRLFDIPMISNIEEMLSDSMYHLDRNANAKIEFLALSLKISEIFINRRRDSQVTT